MADIRTPVPNVFIINDGLKILICKPENHISYYASISESMAAAIYKVITNFDVALTMKRNYASKPAQQTFVIDDPDSEDLYDLAVAVLSINKSARIEAATLFVSSGAGKLTIGGETLVELINVMKDAGAEPDPTFGKYTNIKFCIEPPEVRVMEEGVVYILTVNYKEYAANTCFMVDTPEGGERSRFVFDTKTGELTPTAYGDPEDADSYPAVDEDNIIEGTIGGNNMDTVELHSGVVDGSVTVNASNTVNVVNVDMTDGQIRATIV